jgi:hypothetical protein
LIERRLLAGEDWRYKMFRMYKGTSQSGHEYRDCFAPSALTSLSESYLLGLIAQDSAFKVHSRVYSYQWPRSECSGRSYEFFGVGYHARNQEIAQILEPQGKVAVVTDIRKFYPSISKSYVQNSLNKQIYQKSSLEPKWKEAIEHYFSVLLKLTQEGIPIGPSASHFLGQISLLEVDQLMEARYGNNYFRYVDDIVIVCDRANKNAVEHDIREVLKSFGYENNDEKTLSISSREWHHNIIRNDVSDTDDFRKLTRDLATYIALKPNQINELKKLFKDSGLSIPMERLTTLSKYSRFRYFLHSSLRHNATIFLSSNKDFIQRALRLKSMYEATLVDLIREPVEAEPNLRRWQVQRARRVTNALFYMRNFQEWNVRDPLFNAFPELIEQKALAQALQTGLVDSVLPFYGRVPSAFSELWSEHGTYEAYLGDTKSANTSAEIDALTILRLHGVLSSNTIDNFLQGRDERLLFIANNTNSTVRTQPDLSLEDELESLKIGTSDEEILEISQTRYASNESTGLEALSLLTSEYRS